MNYVVMVIDMNYVVFVMVVDVNYVVMRWWLMRIMLRCD